MVDPISDYISPISPLPNIAPFTYKDGETYLTTLERFRKYVNTDLVSFINNTFAFFDDTFTTEINALIQQVDNALAAQSVENGDNLTAVNAAITNMNTAISNAEDSINTSVTFINGKVTETDNNATSAANSASSAAASAAEAASHALGDGDVAGFISDSGSETYTAIEALLPVAIGDTDVAGFVSDSGSNTHTAIEALLPVAIGDTDIAGYVSDTDSDTHAAIEALLPDAGGVVETITTNDPNINIDSTDSANPVISTNLIGISGPFDDLSAIESSIDTPTTGMLAATDATIYYYNGSTWVPWTTNWIYITPTTGVGSEFTGFTIGNGFVKGRYRYEDGQLVAEMAIKLGSTSSMGSLYHNMGALLSAIIPPWNTDTNFAGVNTIVGEWLALDDETFNIYEGKIHTSGTAVNFYPGISGSSTGIDSTHPFTWTSGSSYSCRFKVQPA